MSSSIVHLIVAKKEINLMSIKGAIFLLCKIRKQSVNDSQTQAMIFQHSGENIYEIWPIRRGNMTQSGKITYFLFTLACIIRPNQKCHGILNKLFNPRQSHYLKQDGTGCPLTHLQLMPWFPLYIVQDQYTSRYT